MSHAPYVPDDNSPVSDALAAMMVVVFFLLMVAVGLTWLGGVPLLGAAPAGDHHAEAAAH